MGPADFILAEQATAAALVSNRGKLLNVVPDAQQKATAFAAFLSTPVSGLSNTTFQQAIAAAQAWATANPTNPSVPGMVQTITDLSAQLAIQIGYAQALAAAVAAVPVPAGL